MKARTEKCREGLVPSALVAPCDKDVTLTLCAPSNQEKSGAHRSRLSTTRFRPDGGERKPPAKISSVTSMIGMKLPCAGRASKIHGRNLVLSRKNLNPTPK